MDAIITLALKLQFLQSTSILELEFQICQELLTFIVTPLKHLHSAAEFSLHLQIHEIKTLSLVLNENLK